MIQGGVKLRAVAPTQKAPCLLPKGVLNEMREFARRLTRGLRRIAECLERDVEMILRENPHFNPVKVAALVTASLIEWEMIA